MIHRLSYLLIIIGVALLFRGVKEHYGFGGLSDNRLEIVVISSVFILTGLIIRKKVKVKL